MLDCPPHRTPFRTNTRIDRDHYLTSVQLDSDYKHISLGPTSKNELCAFKLLFIHILRDCVRSLRIFHLNQLTYIPWTRFLFLINLAILHRSLYCSALERCPRFSQKGRIRQLIKIQGDKTGAKYKVRHFFFARECVLPFRANLVSSSRADVFPPI